MSIAFKELAGSPLETYDKDGVNAERVLLCAWPDRHALLREALGNGYEFGGSSGAEYPGQEQIVVARAKIEPFAADVSPQTFNSLTEGLNSYDGLAKITLSYQQQELSARESNPRNPRTPPNTYLTYRMDFSGEYVQLPVAGYKWFYAPDVPVPPDTGVHKLVPIIDHHFSWQRVIRPPYQAIRENIGKINAYQWFGAAAGTLLFEGATMQREFVVTPQLETPQQTWRIDYKFREKRIYDDAQNRVVGWNWTFRSLPQATAQWDKLCRAGGEGIYAESGGFGDLFQFEIDVD